MSSGTRNRAGSLTTTSERKAPLPGSLDEWSFAIDNSTGNVYFYNRRTRETRWTLPESQTSTTSSLISSLSNAHSVIKEVQAEVKTNSTTRGTKLDFSNEEDLPGSNVTGAGKENSIKEAVDPHTGRKYFYDTLTRQSYWEDPRKPDSNGSHIQRPPSNQPDTPERITLSSRYASSATQTDRLKSVNTRIIETQNVQPQQLRTISSSLDTFSKERNHITTKDESEEEGEDTRQKSSEEGDDWSEPPHAERSPSLTQQRAAGNFDSSKDTFAISESKQVDSTETFIKKSISSKASSQERPTVVYHRDDSEFNEDHLTLLRQRLAQKKLIAATNTDKQKNTGTQHQKLSAGIERSGRSSVQLGLVRENGATEEIGLPNGLTASNLSNRKNDSKIRDQQRALRTLIGSVSREEEVHVAGLAPKRPMDTKCLRMSGCRCAACSTGGAIDTPSPAADELIQCSQCSRRFAPKSLAKHERVCGKVFSAKKASPEQVNPKRPERKSMTPTVSEGMPKWRKQSQELRMAMQRGRGDQTSIDLGPSGANDSDDLVTCPHCERRFSDKAAERHIPKCLDIKSKPRTLRKGEGKAAHSARNSLGGEEDAKTPKSAIVSGRKSLGPSSAIPQVPLGDRAVNLPCPFCKRQFSLKNLERHVDLCSAQRRTTSSSMGGRTSAPGTLMSKSFNYSPSSESSWEGMTYD